MNNESRTIENASEDLVDQKHAELQEAEAERERINTEMDNVFASIADRNEAEMIILTKWDPLMDEAMKKESEAYGAWINAMRERRARLQKEFENMERE